MNTGADKLVEAQRRTGIRRRLVQLILLLVLPLLVIELYLAWSQYQVQRQSVVESRAQTAQSIGRTVSLFVDEKHRNNIALSFSFNSTMPPTTATGNEVLAAFRTSVPYLQSYRFIAPQGQVQYADPPVLVGRDQRDETHVQQILAGADRTVGTLQVCDVDGITPVFAVATAIRDSDGNLNGIMVASVDTSELGRVIPVPIGERGNFSIHDSAGRSIFISSFPDEPYDQRIARAEPRPDFIAGALAGREVLVPSWTSRVDGLERLGASVPINDLGWSASVSEPVADAMAATEGMIAQRLLLFTVVSIAALLLALLFARRLTRPILQLSEAAAEFGQGNLDRRVVVQTRTDELSQLADNFNEMADQVAQETRSREAFLSQASHELKTPLTAIRGYVQLLERRQQSELAQLTAGTYDHTTAMIQRERQIQTLQNLEHQSDRMQRLIERLVEFSRLQAGQMPTDLGLVAILPLIERCLDAARQITSGEKHTLKVQCNPDDTGPLPLLVHGDALRLEQVLLNLLENAIKYSPEGGEITVVLQQHNAGELLPEPSLELSVSDTGLGIDPRDLPRLFDRYYRVQRPDQRADGLGLGLYISSEIVQQHNGRLWATSPGVGQGSTFYLALPLARA